MMFSLPPLPDIETYDGVEYIAPSSLELTLAEFSPKSLESPPFRNGNEEVPMISSPGDIDHLVSPQEHSILSKEDIWDQAVALSDTPRVCFFNAIAPLYSSPHKRLF